MADLYLDPTYARAHDREAVQTIPKVRSVQMGVGGRDGTEYIEFECADGTAHRVRTDIFERLVLP